MSLPVNQSGSDQVFYPSMVVNIRLRFDESLQVDEQQNIPLPLVGYDVASAGLGAFSAVASAIENPTVRPLVTQRGRFSYILNRVPRVATVELPGYRTAGKFTCEFDWREIPIDPRIVRAASVEIYAGCVDPKDFATGMIAMGADGQRKSILSVTRNDGSPRDDLMLITGPVDNWSRESSDGSTVKLEGRDLRGVLLDSPINPASVAGLNLRKSVVQVVHDIMLMHPASQYLYIVWNPNDWTDENGNVIPPPPVADPEGLTRVRRAASGNGATGGAPTGDQTSFWDIITQYCFLVGAIPFFRGRFLVIRPAKSVFDQTKPSGQEPAGSGAQSIGIAPPGSTIIGQTWDPVFANGPRTDDDGNDFSVRKFIYGRNLKKLSFERKFGGMKVPVIQVVSYDTSSSNRGDSKLLTAEWPPQAETAARTTSVSPSGDVAQTDIHRIPVRGIRNQKQLLQIAQALYEEIGRGEMGGACETHFMSSFKGDNSDPDVLRLRPGHAVELAMDARPNTSNAPNAATETGFEAMQFEQAVKYIQTQLQTPDENLPRAIVASARSSVIGQLSQFRTANVKFNWSSQGGTGEMQVAFDFQNYFTPRFGVTPTSGPNTSANKQQIARTPKTQPRGQVPPTIQPRKP